MQSSGARTTRPVQRPIVPAPGPGAVMPASMPNRALCDHVDYATWHVRARLSEARGLILPHCYR
ncbi:hypothetical protein CO2235_U600012 [Cupriavidus oxalaticus]|uniref:Uncharacterized protein n=1 Tax=Cupriavidus oxalaticus TaxID=96344 RepID=A0A375FLJ5_9BURK|nr:hypothetical protein CO2235_U600012 [Cupriavidus oxalaticus]